MRNHPYMQQLAQAHQLGSSVMVSQARTNSAVMVPASAVIAPSQQALYQQRAQLEVSGADLLNFEPAEPASSAIWSSGAAVSAHQPGQLVVGPLRAVGSSSLRTVALTSQRPQQQQQPSLYARQPQIISSTPAGAQVNNRYRLNRPGTVAY